MSLEPAKPATTNKGLLATKTISQIIVLFTYIKTDVTKFIVLLLFACACFVLFCFVVWVCFVLDWFGVLFFVWVFVVVVVVFCFCCCFCCFLLLFLFCFVLFCLFVCFFLGGGGYLLLFTVFFSEKVCSKAQWYLAALGHGKCTANISYAHFFYWLIFSSSNL